MNITRITVLLVDSATDRVTVHTDFPCPFPPSFDTKPLSLHFDVECGKGIEYVRKNFPGFPLTLMDPDAEPMKSEIPNPSRELT